MLKSIRLFGFEAFLKPLAAYADFGQLDPKTVDGYRSAIFTRFRIKNRQVLTLFALKNKIVNLDDIVIEPSRYRKEVLEGLENKKIFGA